ncbi:hypothetical protein Clacol_010577 [Clathrus columnatus]|uniref:Kinesin-like protein n=1 Tax=Clathrus columnatus TaxID=1419009 RepID=A0AAV5AVD3_9AGAM|nr:hypothetical protein Clacol_010577 [Clathrus columnatus]
MADSGDANIKVVVRCRPLNSRELARGAKPLIQPGSEQATSSGGRAAERKTMAFSFDKSYWSAGDRNDPGYCSQQTLYDDLGKELLDHGFSGFNACILAYGQTGSGKSYSMMGYGADKGIIPLTCSELFVRTQEKEERDSNLKFTVEVSYIEIYNEKVRDLLNPKNKGNLKVREHPRLVMSYPCGSGCVLTDISLGPYVEDLSRLVVSSYEDMMTLMDEGNKARTVAATNMNETSSRSHAVFTLLLTMKRHDPETNLDTEKVSRINLVDLAGSERANSTGATGQRLKEGANINKSLTTLGKVISALALASQSDGKVLTWLLKDSLGGNSKTAMIAAISPADYDETLSTLRYADQAKKIKNKAVVNEDPNAKLVRELKEELEMLRGKASLLNTRCVTVASHRLARVAGSSSEDTWDPKVPPEKQVVTFMSGDGTIKKVTKAELQEQLETSEKLMQNLNETWEEKLVRTQEVQKEREKALEELGITVEKNNVGVHTPKKVGRLDSEKPAAIRLSGDNILEEHCYFDNMDGKVTLTTLVESTTFLNGKQVTVGQPYKLRSGYRLILGHHHVFRFNDPEAVRKQRNRANKSNMSQSTTAADLDNQAPTRPESPVSDAVGDVDWTYAQREVAYARLGLDPALDSLPDEDLNNLFERITKVKTLRDHNAKPSRPESSLSQADDVWSEFGRPVPNDALTDDTSVDNGASASQTSPEIHELQGQLEAQKIEYESRLQAISESSEAEDIIAEKEHMEHQLKLVHKQMKRLLEMRAQGAVDVADLVAFEPIIYSAKQLRLIRKVLERWRAHRSFSMAESVLSHAVLVKEANVLSKELKKDVTYNFAIATGGTLAKTMSAHDNIAGLDQFEDVADPILASATQPSVAIKVIDKRHNALYLWSLDRLQQRLQKMRNLTAFVDRPAYSVHFAAEEPFYDSPPRNTLS